MTSKAASLPRLASWNRRWSLRAESSRGERSNGGDRLRAVVAIQARSGPESGAQGAVASLSDVLTSRRGAELMRDEPGHPRLKVRLRMERTPAVKLDAVRRAVDPMAKKLELHPPSKRRTGGQTIG